MLSIEEIKEFLPIPISIEFCSVLDDFKMEVRNSIEMLLIKHNEDYETKIEHIVGFNTSPEEDVDYNECRIYIGRELFHYMKGPDIFEDSSEVLKEFDKSIINVTEGILNTWHEKIIEIQNENELKLEQFKIDGFDEMVYGYYSMEKDRRAFQYLKKLAARYPNSKYANKLSRVYREGLYGWHRANEKLSDKMIRRKNKKNF